MLPDRHAATIGAVIAEFFVLLSWGANRAGGPEFNEVDERVPNLPWGK